LHASTIVKGLTFICILDLQQCIADILKAELEIKQKAFSSNIHTSDAQRCVDEAVKHVQEQLHITERVAMQEDYPDYEQDAREVRHTCTKDVTFW
jgi:predicted Holliday junction resolvase-like endonuclease